MKKKPIKAKKPADSTVGILERGLAILQFFKRMPEAGVADVAIALELSRSTTYRIAERLRELGFLEINPVTARWRLERETVQLGVAALQSTDVMQVAPRLLLSLLEETREAVNLGVFDADSMVLIYREQGPQSVTISSRLGSRRPMHASGLGKAYLAALMNQTPRETVFPRTLEKQVGTLLMFVVRNIFSQPDALKETMAQLAQNGEVSPEMVDLQNPLAFLAHEDGASSLTDAAYRFARHERGADVVLFGTGDERHLRALTV